MPLPQSVRITIEPGFGAVYLYAFWAPPGLTERCLIIGSAKDDASPDLIAAQSSLHNLLMHVYEQGRIDAALGF